MIRVRGLYIVLAFCALAPSILAGDVLVFKSGRVMEGKIIGQSRTMVHLQTGATVPKIPKTQLRRISFGTQVDPPRKVRRRPRIVPKPPARRPPKKQPPRPDENRAGRFLRNAALPGWGALHEGGDVGGLSLAVLFWSATTVSGAQRAAALGANDAYRSALPLYWSLIFASGGPLAGSELAPLVYADISRREFNRPQTMAAAYNQSLGFVALLFLAQLFYFPERVGQRLPARSPLAEVNYRNEAARVLINDGTGSFGSEFVFGEATIVQRTYVVELDGR